MGSADDSFCPKCGSATTPGGRYCAQCGTSLASSNCTNCSANLAPGSKFCPSCGKAC
ncbi:MAG: zinc ribbon domain-containing protein [Alcanivorax sp.]|nr:zinc ribbon domain-containing protein [Alcanivorax sp.]